MPVTFELTVKITGESLGEIDDGLMKAAGERLQARLAKPMSMNFGGENTAVRKFETAEPEIKEPLAPAAEEVKEPEAISAPLAPTVERHEAPATEAPLPAPTPIKRRGRPATARYETYPPTKGPYAPKPAAPVEAPAAEVAKPAPVETPAEEVKEPEAPAANHATLAEVSEALKALNSAKGIEKAREIIALFNVARSSEIAPELRRDFIAKCQEASQ